MDQINGGANENPDRKRNSITLKLIAIVVLVVLFIIPSSMVGGLVQERSYRQDQTIEEVGSSWGGAQSIVGPILVIPYTEINPKTNLSVNKNVYALPDKVAYRAEVKTQMRSRGIYDVPVYNSDVTLSGTFSLPRVNELGIPPNTMNWDRAFVVLGIPDMRGVEEQVTLDWLGLKDQFSPGATADVVQSGMHVRVPIEYLSPEPGTGPDMDKIYTFSASLKLRGSKSLAFVPIGKETTVDMSADWVSPSFAGAFLPREHSITEKGFSASWQVLDLNRNFPSKWKTDDTISIPFEYISAVGTDAVYYPKPYMGDPSVQSSVVAGTFGVNLLVPVDLYQKSTRSAKYAIAVIALVFTMVFFIELTAKRKIHPVQYALIGFALVVFYTLLLSLAEHVGFGPAYIVASVAVIGMITLFGKSIMESWSRAFAIGGLLTVFYVFVYILLQLEDFALLLGSIALFTILGVIMYVSRRIDWYGAGKLSA